MNKTTAGTEFPKSLEWMFSAEEGSLCRLQDIPLDTSSRVAAYVRFDATSDSLHAGHMTQIMLLRHLQREGHLPIVVIGDSTAKLKHFGEKRQPLTDGEIAHNASKMQEQIERLLGFSHLLDFHHSDSVLLRNSEWLESLWYIDFMREYGKSLSMNMILQYEPVRQALEEEEHLSFADLNYMVLQAYDFLEMHREFGCCLQAGGGDQAANLTCGIDLGEALGMKLRGMITPMLNTKGGKMSKSGEGTVWLDPGKTSVYDYWQFWRNTEDSDVGKRLRIYTELPANEVKRLEELKGEEINEAKIILANEATAILHGKEKTREAEEAAKGAFSGAGTSGLPSITITMERLEGGILIYELLREAGLAKNNGEARRLIRGGGARVNDVKVSSERDEVGRYCSVDGHIKLSAGKKRHAVVHVE